MPRRPLLTVSALVLALALGGAGCADQVSPAARIGDATVSHDDLIAEVEAWANSPTLIQGLQIPYPPGNEETGYSTQFVDVVLGNRIAFELHNEEFEALGLELSDEDLELARGALTPELIAELGEEYSDQLIADIARQLRVQQELGDADYPTWAEEAYTRDDIEVSSRYGGWDTATGTVLAPLPPSGPDGGELVEL